MQSNRDFGKIRRMDTGRSAADAAALLEEIEKLMELKGENPFKARAYGKAAAAVQGRDDLTELARAGALTTIPGIGKGISEVLGEFLLQGSCSLKNELASGLPPGILELTRVPGLGPKKALQLIEELEIHSIPELEYACRENRLLKLKGFGVKAQEKILQGIHFLRGTEGQQRLDEAFPIAEKLAMALSEAVKPARLSETGELRRRLETLSRYEFLVEAPDAGASGAGASRVREAAEKALESFKRAHSGLLPVTLHFAARKRFGYELARTTGSEAHWKALGSPGARDAETEEKFYESLGLPWIPPETRESGEEIALARSGKLGELLPWDGVQGVFHNHTTRSDGTATLEEMVVAAKKLGFRYIGISDHSQSAFYAQGLKVPTLVEQEKEIRKIQEKHPEIRVFWGIESDILQDGSLDYDAAVLDRFDFVIASIHSRFQMDRQAMTDRILEAIRNPHTRFLGHATGRLLLGRKGYDLDMERVIEEAAKRGVAIEINANPARLDIDWRWGKRLRECGTAVSVNPDAHETAGLEDTRFGVAVARKALLPRAQVVNSRSVAEVEKWLKRG